MPDPNLSLASGDQHSRIVGLVTLAFSQDPLFRWMFKRSDDYLEKFPLLISHYSEPALKDRTLIVDDQVNSASIWIGSGSTDENSADSTETARLMKELIGEPGFSLLLELYAQLVALRLASGAAWYLPFLAVDPLAQGKRLGSANLNFAHQHLVQDSTTFLETAVPENVAFYRRLGYEVVGEAKVGDVPRMIAMVRNTNL